MLHVYGNPFSSPSNKVRYAVSALGLEHEFHLVDLAKGAQREADYIAVNPFSRVPAIKDDDFALFESDAINAYLAEKEGSDIYPVDMQGRAMVNQWVSFASQHIAQSMGRVFFNRVVHKFLGAEPDENSLAFGLRTLESNLAAFDPIIATRKFVTGDSFTLADIALVAALDPAELAQVDLSGHSHVADWRKRVMAMPFYQNVHSHFGAELGM